MWKTLLVLGVTFYTLGSTFVFAQEPKEAVFEPRFSTDWRLRYQSLERDGFDEDGIALTARLRTALEIDILPKTTFLAEAEGNLALVDNFNDGRQILPTRPFIPDPEGLELNRLQITTEILPKTRLTLGRQKIALDDWRFIGSFPFRQNDQTIDALRVETRVFGAGVLDIGYFNKVHRPLGQKNINGVFEGDSYFANYNIGTPLGRLSTFHYSLGLESGPLGSLRQDASSETTGFRILGRRDEAFISYVWEGSYARQNERGGNPADYSADYILGEFTLKPGQFTFKTRAEILGSDQGHSVQTPLASLHRFQGFSDQFLTTPPDGLRDYSVFLEYDLGRIGPFRRVKTFARHHWFESHVNKRAYGKEINLSLTGRLEGFRMAIEYADYKAQTFSANSRALFLSAEFDF
jgi:hypothetical protein